MANAASQNLGAHRSPKAEATRERIVEAAADAFGRSGYLGVNLNDVMQNLGLTKGALYYFFPRKEDLAAEIMRRHTANFSTLFTQVIEGHENLLDALIALGYTLAGRYRMDKITQAGSRLATESNLIHGEVEAPFGRWVDCVAELLAAAQARGEVRPDANPRIVAQMLVSHLHGAQSVSACLTDRQDLTVCLDQFWAAMDPWLRSPS